MDRSTLVASTAERANMYTPFFFNPSADALFFGVASGYRLFGRD